MARQRAVAQNVLTVRAYPPPKTRSALDMLAVALLDSSIEVVWDVLAKINSTKGTELLYLHFL